MASNGNLCQPENSEGGQQRFWLVLPTIVLAYVLSLLIRYGLDVDAWNIALHHADAFVCPLVVLVLPVMLGLSALLRRFKGRVGMRIGLSVMIALAAASTCFSSPNPVRDVIGGDLPAGAHLLSGRTFNSFAGGGEMYTYTQFTIAPHAFRKLMVDNGFIEEPLYPDVSVDGQIGEFTDENNFRFSIERPTRAMKFTKNWAGRENDRSDVLYDSDRQIVHAKRIRG